MEKSIVGRRHNKGEGPEAGAELYDGGTLVRSFWLEHSVWEEVPEKTLEK